MDNPYLNGAYRDDKEFVLKKLGLTETEFEQIMSQPPRKHTDFPSYAQSFLRYQRILSSWKNKILFRKKPLLIPPY
jgi:hypothetical protein